MCIIIFMCRFSDLQAYLKHIMKSTNMACLTPEGAMSGDCDFLSANLYARSLFGKCSYLAVEFFTWSQLWWLGEDALANLSIEKTDVGTIVGHVRIRSKTQGIALSLGDRITIGEFSFYSFLRILLTISRLPAQKENKTPSWLCLM